MRGTVAAFVLLGGGVGCDLQNAGEPAFGGTDAYRLVDLSHAYSEDTLIWPSDPSGFVLTELASGETPAGYFYSAYLLNLPEHSGTHLDAPHHFSANGDTNDEITLARLMAPAVVIDVVAQASADRDYRLSVEDVLAHERRHGAIAAGSIVLLHTGWDRYWPDALAYLGDDTPGDASRLSFPSYGEAAARLLVEERRVAVLGVDTASIDYGRSSDFPVHRVVAAANVPAIENLTGLGALPRQNFTVIALPMKIKGGSGGPVRVVALTPP